jgi:DNA-binding MarR family transcriptional regulator
MLASTTRHLIALQRTHRAALEPRLADLGLSYGSELALATIARQPGITLTELAERLDVKPPSVTKVIRTLERDGFVDRERDPNDGRVSRLLLTAAGRRVCAGVERAWTAAEDEVLASLGRSQRAQLRGLLVDALRARDHKIP